MNNTQPLSPSDAECIDLAAPFYERSEHGVKLNVPALVRALLASAKQTTTSPIAQRKADELRADGFEDYAIAAVLRKDGRYCIVGSLGDVRWHGQQSTAPAPSLPSGESRNE